MDLEMKLSEVKGVGPKTAEILESANLLSVGDLINFLPRTYEDFSKVTPIRDLRPGKVTVKALVESVVARNIRWRMSVTEAILNDGTGKVRAVWFNQSYRKKQLETGAEFYFSGEFGLHGRRYQIMSPSAELVKDLPIQAGRILPIYPQRRGLKANTTRKILNELRPIITMLPESLPAEIVRREKLAGFADAMLGLHFPESAEEADAGFNRLAFQELFELLLATRLNKQENCKLQACRLEFNQPKIKEFVAALPFQMTGAQKRALWDILCDFDGSVIASGAKQSSVTEKSGLPRHSVPRNDVTPMNRMLQGDVGSGKTVVAGAAAFQASLAGFQSAILAPTEILATQHAETLSKLLSPFGISVVLLTGGVKSAVRLNLTASIADGSAQVIVGTHAIFQDKVKFHNLGFVVIDEQHRFGVKQRQALLAKSSSHSGLDPESNQSHRFRNKSGMTTATMPHLLTMTATPIPRSLQLTVFGDLDVSILNELPAGRKKIATKIWKPTNRENLYKLIKDQLAEGRQAYIITPLIEESSARHSGFVPDAALGSYQGSNQSHRFRNKSGMTDNIEKKSAEIEFEKIKKKFREYKVGILHGKMKADEKEQAMRDFAANKTQILVATTVVEVGVDVPNATVMLIENADMFGLAQLHQLRGRVGRGEHQSYCYLMLSESKNPSKRLLELEKSNDGFYLSEVDLKLRGPGEIYGTMQHGQLDLQVASLADTKTISRAAKAADWFIENKNLSDFPIIAENVTKYQKLTTLN